MTPLQRLQVFMLYPNAKVNEIQLEGIFTIAEIDKRTNNFILRNDNFQRFIADVRNCQLILRGIDQLTEEEKRELAGIIGLDEKYADDCVLGLRVNHYFENTWIFRNSTFQRIVDAADYLRSKNIALPYMGIDLFKEGIAVREN